MSKTNKEMKDDAFIICMGNMRPLSIKQAAMVMNVSENKIRTYIENGDLPYIPEGENRKMILPKDISALQDKLKVTANTKPRKSKKESVSGQNVLSKLGLAT